VSQLGIEQVVFQAAGLDEIVAQTESLKDRVKNAHAEQLALNRALSDGSYQKALDATKRLRDENQRLLNPVQSLTNAQKARMELDGRAARLRSGYYDLEQKQLANIRREREKMDQAERRANLASGVYGRTSMAAVAARRENASLAAAERRVDLQSQYGRRLGGLAHAAEQARPYALAAGAAGGIGLGMARAGFSGTVTQEKLSLEMQLLNREIAATLSPAIRALTSALTFIRRKMETLSPEQQNLAGLAIGGGAALGGLGLAANGIASVGRLLGFGLAPAAGAEVGGSVAAGLGGAARAAPGAGRLAGGLRAAGRVAPWAAAAVEGYGEYQRFSETGFTGRNVANFALRALDVVPFGRDAREGFDATLGRLGASGGRRTGEHRSELIADSGFESFDEAYRRVSSSTALVESSNASSEAQFQEINTTLKDIKGLLEQQQANNPRPLR
jgi:hypothetical protein